MQLCWETLHLLFKVKLAWLGYKLLENAELNRESYNKKWDGIRSEWDVWSLLEIDLNSFFFQNDPIQRCCWKDTFSKYYLISYASL